MSPRGRTRYVVVQGIMVSSSRYVVHAGTGDEGWVIHTDDSLRFRGHIMVPQFVELREEILKEFH